jgi:hypothetical protein
MKNIQLPVWITGTALMGFLMMGGFNGCDKKPTETTDTFNEDLYNIRLTEINYNPEGRLDLPGDSLEFLELKNVGATTLQLGALEITDGVTYTFPDTATLAAGEFYVIASNAAAFEKVYGFAPDGVYSGVLSNRGEVIALKDIDHHEDIFTQVYADTGLWSEKADGKGYSLVSATANPPKDSVGPAFWVKSAQLGGSPGADDVTHTVDTALFNLRITEISYNPLAENPADNDSIEFIELKNVGSTTVNLGTVIFTDGIDYAFPSDAKVEAGAFIVLVSNEAKFKAKYPSATPFGVFDGQLSNGGEKVTLFDVNADTNLAVVNYKDGGEWPKKADGDGFTLVPISKNPVADQNNPVYWRQSRNVDGSPGADDPGVAIINEVLTHTDLPQVDSIELYNPGDESVDVGGWYISDSKSNPIKFQIPGNTVIPAGGYLCFGEGSFNADPASASAFTFNSHGEAAWLISDERGCAFGYCNGFSFGELENGISIGRYVNSQGNEMYVAQKNISFGKENDGPLVGPLVISEIMYHSPDNTADYVEITNISGAAVSLSHPDYPDHTWKISGTGFSFPAGVTIKPDESVVVADDSLTEDSLRSLYGIPAEVQVFFMPGALDNSSERLALQKPEDPYIKDTTVTTDSLVYPYMIYDEVDYSDSRPWPVGEDGDDADGGGKALHRKKLDEFGDDPLNWLTSDPTPGNPDAY